MRLVFDLRESISKLFIKFLSQFKLPYCDRLCLNYLPPDSEEVKNFLLNSFSNGIKGLCLNQYNEDKIIPIDYYFESLKIISNTVEEDVLLGNFEITNDQFWQLLDANKHRQGYIDFQFCEILTELNSNPYDLKGFKGTTLSFRYSKFVGRGDRKNHPEYFVNIIQKLSKVQDIRNNLSTIKIGICSSKSIYDSDILDVRKILDENGFNKVKIR